MFKKYSKFGSGSRPDTILDVELDDSGFVTKLGFYRPTKLSDLHDSLKAMYDLSNDVDVELFLDDQPFEMKKTLPKELFVKMKTKPVKRPLHYKENGEWVKFEPPRKKRKINEEETKSEEEEKSLQPTISEDISDEEVEGKKGVENTGDDGLNLSMSVSVKSIARDDDTPKGFFGCAAAFDISGGRFVISGGLDTEGKCHEKAGAYEPDLGEWEEHVDDEMARCFHTLTYIKSTSQMFAFGGLKNGDFSSEPITTTRFWEDNIWAGASLTGDTPKPRFGHSMVLLGDSTLFLWGGFDSESSLCDSYLLDTENWVWKKANILGEGPSPRGFHTATSISGNRIAFVGGADFDSDSSNEVFILNFDLEKDELSWTKPTLNGQFAPRCLHSATVIEEDRIAIVGGRTKRKDGENVKDHFILNLKSMAIEPLASLFGLADISCGGHVARATEESEGNLMIWGGKGDADYQNIRILQV